jgi:hypothetical protein
VNRKKEKRGRRSPCGPLSRGCAIFKKIAFPTETVFGRDFGGTRFDQGTLLIFWIFGCKPEDAIDQWVDLVKVAA